MSQDRPFEAFMRDFQDMVYSTARRLLGNEADALDISQEVFLKAHARYDELAQNPAAPGWLKTVTTNLCLNHLSRYRARWRFFSEMFSSDDGSSFEASLPAPDRREEQDNEAFRRHHLEQALQKLPAAQRVPLVLFHFDEMSYEEISAKLHISLSKVKTDIHRGRESLRRWLDPNLDRWEAKQARPREAQNGLPPAPFAQTCLAAS